MQFCKVFTSLTLILSVVKAVPTILEDPTRHLNEEYTITEPQWSYNLPDGTTLKVNGTVEKLVHELNKSYPDWENDESIIARALPAAEVAARDTSPNPLSKRAIWTHHYCHYYDHYPARTTDIRAGISYLRRLGGGPWLGSRTCSRISCSYDSAIWLCNDNYHDISIAGWAWPADSAQEIINRCIPNCWICDTVIGYIHEVGNWNVVVRGDANNC